MNIIFQIIQINLIIIIYVVPLHLLKLYNLFITFQRAIYMHFQALSHLMKNFYFIVNLKVRKYKLEPIYFVFQIAILINDILENNF